MTLQKAELVGFRLLPSSSVAGIVSYYLLDYWWLKEEGSSLKNFVIGWAWKNFEYTYSNWHQNEKLYCYQLLKGYLHPQFQYQGGDEAVVAYADSAAAVATVMAGFLE